MLLLAVVLAVVASACGSDGAVAQGCGGSIGGSSGGGSSGGATTSSTPAPPESAATSPALRVVFVDVGQGDAAALRSGAWTGLVDGGPSGSEAVVGAALAELGVRRLNTLVVSHMHADHTAGLPALIRRYRPRWAWVVGSITRSLAAALRGAGTKVVQVRRGLTARFGKAKVTVLAPGSLSGDANADSIVLLLQAGGRRVVFTGDSTGSGEAAAGVNLARGPPVDVLKVAHHGSRASTTAAFVGAARPRMAVISVGRNSYGHPTNETVQRLRRGGARVYSTQKNGAVTLTITGRGAIRLQFTRSSAPRLSGG